MALKFNPFTGTLDIVKGEGTKLLRVADKEALFNLSPSNGDLVYVLSVNKFYYYQDAWEELSASLNVRAGPMDMGLEQDSALTGYGFSYITDKKLSNVSIGENASPVEGAIRTTFAESLETKIPQFYLEGSWKTVLAGIFIQTDDTENPVDIEFLNFEPWVLSLITGNSDSISLSGLPTVQNMKTDIGSFQTPIVVNGGTF